MEMRVLYLIISYRSWSILLFENKNYYYIALNCFKFSNDSIEPCMFLLVWSYQLSYPITSSSYSYKSNHLSSNCSPWYFIYLNLTSTLPQPNLSLTSKYFFYLSEVAEYPSPFPQKCWPLIPSTCKLSP